MAIPKLALIPSGVKAGKLYSVLPTNGDGDFTTTRNTVASRVNENGLIEEVAANVPRLDYSDGGCPSLLLEGTATNVVVYSEDFTQTNWNSASGVQLSSTTTLTPSGSTNAVRIKNVGGVNNDLRSVVSITSGLTYTNSIYMRRVSGVGSVILKHVNGGGSSINGLTSEWQKFSSTVLSNSTNGRFYLEVSTLNDEIEVWGAQTEQNSYSTSYIKTIGTAQTRSADTATGAGDATTFNSSEGVLMFEVSTLTSSGGNRIISLTDGTSANKLEFNFDPISNRFTLVFTANSSNQYIVQLALNEINFNKIAVKYKSNDFALWINGIELNSQLSGNTSLSNSFDRINLANQSGGFNFYGNTKQIQYYDSALNDSDLEKITSWTSFTAMANGQSYTII